MVSMTGSLTLQQPCFFEAEASMKGKGRPAADGLTLRARFLVAGASSLAVVGSVLAACSFRLRFERLSCGATVIVIAKFAM
jgi:hypothetical protein